MLSVAEAVALCVTELPSDVVVTGALDVDSGGLEKVVLPVSEEEAGASEVDTDTSEPVDDWEGLAALLGISPSEDVEVGASALLDCVTLPPSEEVDADESAEEVDAGALLADEDAETSLLDESIAVVEADPSEVEGGACVALDEAESGELAVLPLSGDDVDTGAVDEASAELVTPLSDVDAAVGVELALSVGVEADVSVLTGAAELESEVAVDSTDEMVESPDGAVLEAEFASVEVMEAVESVTGAAVDVCDESVDEVGPVELDSSDVAVSVDVAEVEVAEAVSWVAWLDGEEDEADGSVVDAVVKVAESTDDVADVDESVDDAADDSVDGDDVSGGGVEDAGKILRLLLLEPVSEVPPTML